MASAYIFSSPLIKLLSILFISYGFSYFIAKKLPKGILRLISMLGVFYALFTVPWYFPSSIFLRGFTSFFISWISSFKLVLFAFDQGDLALSNTFTDFVAVAVFPLKIKSRSSSSPSSSYSSLLRNILLILVLSTIIFFFRDITLSFSTLCVVIFCDLCTMPQFELIPLINQPHKSTSLQVFWGKRWNRISSNVLRETIYDPINAAMKRYLDDNNGGFARVLALIMALIVSGIMHEIMFYHMTCGMKPTWEVTYFFVLQGFCMALEIGIKRLWVRTLGWSTPHPILSVGLTLGFVLTSSYWLLVLPVWRIAGMGCDL
ncbi:putative long-chain-alcohol O-fatty-acyltransferase 9 [Silene latifolia]|uniref:putative long-chain-alcohol O-fatty-acyltransferase 9 n=1 Tax=Silene latifolia TaxID=37657 RepID=UPI003D78948D